MTAPLYDIKAKFSEYVTMAEQGEVVEITKHGVATSVIISIKLYNQMKEEYEELHRSSFMDCVRKWRAECGGLTQEEADEYCNTLDRLREEQRKEDMKNFFSGVNPWD